MHLPLLVPFLFWISGCSSAQGNITGPKEVSGQEQGSLSVQCRYTSSWKDYKKYWCRGAYWNSCEIVIETDKSEQLVKKNRMSIKDDQTDCIVTVTIEELRMSDAGVYWCAIEKSGYDHKFKVDVSIDPAPITVLTTLPITSTTNMFTETATVIETSMFPTLSSHYPDDRNDSNGGIGSILNLSVLLPVVSAVLLLLLLVASLFAWRMVRRQKKAPGPPMEQVQSLEGDLCYANLSLKQPRSSRGSLMSAKAHQEEAEYVTMAPFPREEISYAALSLAALGQEPIYSNSGSLATHIPRTDLEETTEYSSIRRP